jgi:hypothetical protein
MVKLVLERVRFARATALEHHRENDFETWHFLKNSKNKLHWVGLRIFPPSMARYLARIDLLFETEKGAGLIFKP